MSEKDGNDEISIALAPLSMEQIKSLKKEDLALLLFHEQKLRLQLQTLYAEAQKTNVELQEKKLLLESRFVLLKNKFFGKSSERSPQPKPESQPDPKKNKKKKKKRQKPSERYPDLPLIERDLQLESTSSTYPPSWVGRGFASSFALYSLGVGGDLPAWISATVRRKYSRGFTPQSLQELTMVKRTAVVSAPLSE